jgi:hypothetical protein
MQRTIRILINHCPLHQIRGRAYKDRDMPLILSVEWLGKAEIAAPAGATGHPAALRVLTADGQRHLVTFYG